MRFMFAAIVAAVLAIPMPLAAQQSTESNPAQPLNGASPAQPSNGANSAEEPKIDVTQNEDWEVACQEVDRDGTKDEVCEMRQILVQKDTDNEWLRLAISYGPESSKPVLRIFTPLGVLLQPGLQMKIDDGEAMRMQFAVCLSRPPRCLVAGPMDSQMVAMMKKGIKGTITLVLPNNREVSAPFSLAGFTKSINSLPK